jgi:hypothetical protein
VTGDLADLIIVAFFVTALLLWVYIWNWAVKDDAKDRTPTPQQLHRDECGFRTDARER